MWGKSEAEAYSHTFMDILCACETGRKWKTNVMATGEEGERGRDTSYDLRTHCAKKSKNVMKRK